MSVPNPIIVPLRVSNNTMVVPMGVGSNAEQIAVGLGYVVVTGMPAHYTGSYEFTPSDEVQTISIQDQMADADIIINPIPSNYGRVTWNGSVLTIS